MITINDFAGRMNVHVATARRIIDMGKGPNVYYFGRSVRLDADEVEEWIRSMRAKK